MKDFNIDHIKVSDKLDVKVRNSIDKAFKANKVKKYNLNKKIAVASITVLGIGTLSLSTPTVIAKIKEFKTTMERLLNIENPEIEKYSNVFFEEVISNDISVKINDLILDNHSIKTTASIDISKSKNKGLIKAKNKIEYIEPNITLSINDKKLGRGTLSSLSDKINNDKYNNFTNTRLMDDNLKNHSSLAYKNNKIIEDIFNGSSDSKIKIKLEILSMRAHFSTESDLEPILLTGNWIFEKEISLAELISKINTFKINKTIEFKEDIFNKNNKSITIKELTTSPISISLKYEYYLDSPFISFNLYDENNNIIDCFSSMGEGSQGGPIHVISEFNGNIKGNIIKIVPVLLPQAGDNYTENTPLPNKSISINIKTGEILE